jgi:hypothetical protein
VQVIKQFEQAGSAANRYDVTILVNGLPKNKIKDIVIMNLTGFVEAVIARLI